MEPNPDLNPEERRKLAAMVTIHREFTAAATARISALVRGQAMVMSGLLTVGNLAQALGVSEATWHRWARDLGLRELAADVVADLDTALRAAGADQSTTTDDIKNTPELELAAGAAGAWRKS